MAASSCLFWPAFDDKDLTETFFIELEPNETFCDELLDVEILEDEYSLNIYPNPANDYIVLEWDAGMYTTLDIYNSVGQKIELMTKTGGKVYLDITTWQPGMYYVMLEGKKVAKLVVGK